jgi:hypothetical protein
MAPMGCSEPVSEINVAEPLWSEGSATLLADSSVRGTIIGPSGRQRVDCAVDHFPIKVSEGDFNPYALQARGSQLTRPHARVVTQRLGDGMPWFVRVSNRLR